MTVLKTLPGQFFTSMYLPTTLKFGLTKNEYFQNEFSHSQAYRGPSKDAGYDCKLICIVFPALQIPIVVSFYPL